MQLHLNPSTEAATTPVRGVQILRGAWLLSRPVALLMVVLFTPRQLWAQGADSEVRLDQLSPAPAGSPFTRSVGPHESLDDAIAYALRLDTDYLNRPLETQVTRGGEEVGAESLNPVAHALLLHLGASLTPFDWLQFELGAPFAAFEQGDDEFRGQVGQALEAGSPGIGDIRLGALFRPYESQAFDFTAGVRGWAPTGSPGAYMSGDDRFFRIEALLGVAGEASVLTYGCTFGIAPLFFTGRDGDRLAASCGFAFQVAPTLSVGVEPHVAAFTFSAPGESSANTPGLDEADLALQIEPLASMRFAFAGFSVGLAGGPGFGGAPATPDGRFVLTLGYSDRGDAAPAPVIKDRDLDGLSDEEDACPDEAGPKARKGCPAPVDLDGDNIVDDEDACPEERGASFEDPRANGCPDTDNDRRANPLDACPEEPSDNEDGCPTFARLSEEGFTLTPALQFTGRSTELPEGAAEALAEVVRTVRANPDLPTLEVRVGGKGATTSVNKKRGLAVRNALKELNLSDSRFKLVLDKKQPGGGVTIGFVSP
ncbi:MAG: hypothetical protein AAGA56_07975 [Myxococcota bacterium]